MACRRSQDIDLPAFLADPRQEGFAEFRRHYPGCPDCSAELRVWTELHEALAAQHPEPERLARYGDLEAVERAAIDRHAARCAGCREELAMLAAFDPAMVVSEALVRPRAPSLLERLRASLAPVGRVVWHPAFAYGLLGVILLPLVLRLATSPSAPMGDQLFAAADRAAPDPARLAMPEAEQVAPEPVFAAEQVVPEPPAAPSPGPVAESRPIEPSPFEARERRADLQAASSDPQPGADAESLARRAAVVPAEPRARAKVVPGEPPAGSPVAGLRQTPSFSQEPRDPPDVLRLDTWRTVERRWPGETEALRILVPLADTAEGDEAWIEIRDLDRDRKRRERVALPARGEEERVVEVRLPGAWLQPGSYRVELEGVDAPALRFRLLR